jgi:hypothetical protein
VHRPDEALGDGDVAHDRPNDRNHSPVSGTLTHDNAALFTDSAQELGRPTRLTQLRSVSPAV